ncbi:MAG: DinB family protein [Saprospiraceae bacterium]|nr:DinB family protein [Pyrinomonadaceae bacterium]
MQSQKKEVRLVDPILAEIEQEAETTKRLFGIVPEDKLSWRPHPKAMSLGQLALHIAQNPGAVAEFTDADSAQIPDFVQAAAASRAEILEALAESLRKTKEFLSSTSDERALSEWKLMDGDKVVLSMPRAAFWRSMLNHNYHHRGQLSTYLRQLDIPLPSIYGPSADTIPFG